MHVPTEFAPGEMHELRTIASLVARYDAPTASGQGDPFPLPGSVTVTVITGLNPVASNLDAILARLKSACAAGGTLNEGRIEIQGDHRERAVSFLQSLGYPAKLSGG